MLVVSDASALNVLIRVALVDVLPALFNEIVIPTAVADELLDIRAPLSVREFITRPPVWLVIRTPQSLLSIAKLGAGEHAAISLAREIGADVLLIDERRGRRVAEGLNLRVVGTIGTLEMAAARNLIALPEALARIRQTDFSVSDDIIDGALRRDARRRDQGS